MIIFVVRSHRLYTYPRPVFLFPVESTNVAPDSSGTHVDKPSAEPKTAPTAPNFFPNRPNQHATPNPGSPKARYHRTRMFGRLGLSHATGVFRLGSRPPSCMVSRLPEMETMRLFLNCVIRSCLDFDRSDRISHSLLSFHHLGAHSAPLHHSTLRPLTCLPALRSSKTRTTLSSGSRPMSSRRITT